MTAIALAGTSFNWWPTASNTGYLGASLTNSALTTIATPGTYTNLKFTAGFTQIQASNVTLNGCLIDGSALTSGNFFLSVLGGLSNVVIQNCQIVGPGTNSTQVGTYGIYVEGDSQVTTRACDVGFVGTCAQISGGQLIIEDNYFHDLGAASGTHYECIYYGGDANGDFSMLLQHNSLINQLTQTAAVFIESINGPVQNITINNNKMIGGSFPQYVDGHSYTPAYTNIVITNNALGMGSVGYFDLQPPLGGAFYGVTGSGNYDAITGAPVTSPPYINS